MDDTGRLGRLHPLAVGPGARLVGSRGEEGLQVQELVGRLDEARHARLLQPHLLEEHLALFVLLQLGDVGLGGGGDDQHLGLLAGDGRPDGFGVRVARHGALLVDVADIQHGFVGQQVEVGDQLAVLLLQLDGAGRESLFQHLLVVQ